MAGCFCAWCKEMANPVWQECICITIKTDNAPFTGMPLLVSGRDRRKRRAGNVGEAIVTDKKITVQFAVLTVCIAYLVPGVFDRSWTIWIPGLQLGQYAGAIWDEHSVCALYFVARDGFLSRI